MMSYNHEGLEAEFRRIKTEKKTIDVSDRKFSASQLEKRK